jgi:toxin ParE1/3/4
MARLVWTASALDDLEGIAEYIDLSNPPAAKNLVRTVFDKVARLKKHPESARVPPELAGLNYREVVAPACRIFYRFDGDKVLVLHVMSQERDLRKFLLSNEPDRNSSN